MKKAFSHLLILIGFCYFGTTLHATIWQNISLEDLINKSDLILIGTVSDVTTFFKMTSSNTTLDVKYFRPEARFQMIKVDTIIYTNQKEMFSHKSTKFIYTLEKMGYVLDPPPILTKDSTYLMFLRMDTTVNRTYLKERNLPSSNYVFPAYSIDMSLIPVKEPKYKTTLKGIEKILGPLPKNLKFE